MTPNTGQRGDRQAWLLCRPDGELFDVQNDPCEYRNLWDHTVTNRNATHRQSASKMPICAPLS